PAGPALSATGDRLSPPVVLRPAARLGGQPTGGSGRVYVSRPASPGTDAGHVGLHCFGSDAAAAPAYGARREPGAPTGVPTQCLGTCLDLGALDTASPHLAYSWRRPGAWAVLCPEQ